MRSRAVPARITRIGDAIRDAGETRVYRAGDRVNRRVAGGGFGAAAPARRRIELLAFLAVLAALAAPVAARASHVLEADPAFGQNGQALVAGLQPSALAARPGGLLVVESGGFGVAALTSAGGLDLTFGERGRATIEIPRADAQPQAVTVDAKGRVVVAGSATYVLPHPPATHEAGHVTAMAAARFLADGTPDPDFGTGGFVLLPFSDGASEARSALVLGDGGVVLAGSARDGQMTAVAMLDDAGRPDPRFGSNGRIVIDGGPGSEGARAVIAVPGDRLVVAGVTSTSDAYAARLTPTGPDAGFGDGGVFAMPGTAGDTAAAGAMASGDRVLLPGRFRGRHGVLALDHLGRVDRAYGDRGVAEVQTPAGLGLIGVVRATVDPAGTLTQTWEVLDPIARRSHLMVQRFDAAGRRDGDPAGAAFAFARTVTPIGVVGAGPARMLILARAHGPHDLIGGALVRLRPAPHPATTPKARRSRRCGHARRSASAPSRRARCKRR